VYDSFFPQQVSIQDKVTVGSGPTKKVAKFEAAKAMLELLDGVKPKASRREVNFKDI
jgi:dsRNA-specific ribonuclease